MRRIIGVVAALAVAGACAPSAGAVELVQVANLPRPTAITAAPGDASRLYVVQQTGPIRVIRDGVLLPAPFLDLRAAELSTPVSGYSERGVLGLAFGPGGRFYVHYTDRDGDIHIDEFQGSGDSADVGTRRPLVTIPHQVNANHNGGQLAFGPDGRLYAGIGDGGSANDPADNGQNLTDQAAEVIEPGTCFGGPCRSNQHPLLGKLLRLDPAASDAAAAGNPFPAPAAQVWALGLRNPYRFSFDRLTGDLVVADVGQGGWEEVNLLRAGEGGGRGANLGWDAFEGDHPFSGTPLNPAAPQHHRPVLEYASASPRCSIIGGYVWRDSTSDELAGQYVFGDWCEGKVLAAQLGQGGFRDLGLARVGGITTFGEDALGRLYVGAQEGAIYRIAGAPKPGTPGAPGAPGSPSSDTTAPRLTLTAARRQRPLRTGVVRVRARCDEQCTIEVSARPRVARRGGRLVYVRGARTRRTLAANATVSLSVRLSRASRRSIARALRADRRASVRFTVTATDAAKNRRSAVVTARLVR